MLYLTTGANGAGKTLLTLRDVREKSLKESRPVCYNGRFELTADFGWKKADFKDWQDEPDGTIFIVDECHNDMPVRSTKDAAPDYIRQLAEHRRRGFDFYLITQHPMNIDAFVRRLIGSPGWHRHLKRASGAPLVSVLSWAAVKTDCEKAGSGASGSTTMVPYPKEVYQWYASTSLDTAKVKIPFQVKLLVAAVLLVPLLGYFGYSKFIGKYDKAPEMKGPASGAQPVMASAARPGDVPHPVSAGDRVLSPVEYMESFAPRVEGLSYTAPRYDAITKPVTAPFPAACVSMGSRCECYTQQGTKLSVPLALCTHIVQGGFFEDWAASARGVPAAAPVTVADRAVPAPVAAASSSGAVDSGLGYGLRNTAYMTARNGATKSSVKDETAKTVQ